MASSNELEILNKQLSSLAAQNKRRTADSAQVHCAIAKLQLESGDFDNAISSCGKCLDILDDIKSDANLDIEVEAFCLWAEACTGLNKFAEAQTKFFQALMKKLKHEKKDTSAQCAILKSIVLMMKRANKIDAANDLRDKIEAIEKSIDAGQENEFLVASLLYELGTKQTNIKSASGYVEEIFRFLIQFGKDNYPPGEVTTPKYIIGLGNVLKNLQKYEDAKYVLSEALETLRAHFKDDKVDGLVVADAANSLGLCYRGLGRFDEAEAYLMEALTLRKMQLDDHGPAVAGSLNNLAELFRDKGNIGQSIMFHESAIATFETCLGPDHPSTINARGNLGITLSHNARMGTEAGMMLVQHVMKYLEDNNYEEDHPWTIKFRTEVLLTEAERHVRLQEFDDALEIYEKVMKMNPFPKQSDVSIVIARQNWNAKYQKAVKLRDDAKYEAAKNLFKDCMDDALNQYDPNDPVMCDVTFAQAENLRLKGEAEGAKELYEVLLKIRSTNLGGGHALCARLINALAVCAMDAEKLAEAEVLFEQALTTISRAVFESKFDEYCDEKAIALIHAQTLYDFAELNRRRGNYSHALDKQDQSIKIRLLWLEENTILVAQSRLQKAKIFFELGCLLDAEVSNDQSLAIFRHRFDDESHPYIAEALCMKCEIDITNGKIEEAKKSVSAAKRIVEGTFANDSHHAVTLATYLSGLVVHASGQYRQTEKIYKEVIYRSKKMYGQYSIMAARAACASAESHMHSGNFREASTLFREAMAIQERVIGRHHPHYLRTICGLARNLMCTGNYNDSTSYFETIRTLLDEVDSTSREQESQLDMTRPDLQHINFDIPIRSDCILARADLLSVTGEFDKASEMCSNALQMRKKMYGSSNKHPLVIEAIFRQAENWRARGQYRQKLNDIYEEIITNLMAIYSEDHPAVVEVRQAFCDFLIAFSDEDKAIVMCRTELIDCSFSIGRYEGPKSIRYASVCISIAMALMRESQINEAKKYLDDALRIAQGALDSEHVLVGDIYNNMAICCIEQAAWTEAESLCVKAYGIYKLAMGLEHPRTVNCQGNLGLVMISAEHTLTAGLKNITTAHDTLLEYKFSSTHPWLVKFKNGQEYVMRRQSADIVSGSVSSLGEGDFASLGVGDGYMSEPDGSLNSVERDIVTMELSLEAKDVEIKNLEKKYALLQKQYSTLCENPPDIDVNVSDKPNFSTNNDDMLEHNTRLENEISGNHIVIKELEQANADLTAKLEQLKSYEARGEDIAMLPADEKELKELRSNIMQLESDLKIHQDRADGLEVVVGDVKSECDHLARELANSQAANESSNAMLIESVQIQERLKEDIRRLEGELSSAREANQSSSFNLPPLSPSPMDSISAQRCASPDVSVRSISDEKLFEMKEELARLKRLVRRCQCKALKSEKNGTELEMIMLPADEKELKELRSNIIQLESDLKIHQDRADGLEVVVGDVKSECDHLARELANSQAANESSNAMLIESVQIQERLKEDIRRLEGELSSAREASQSSSFNLPPLSPSPMDSISAQRCASPDVSVRSISDEKLFEMKEELARLKRLVRRCQCKALKSEKNGTELEIAGLTQKNLQLNDANETLVVENKQLIDDLASVREAESLSEQIVDQLRSEIKRLQGELQQATIGISPRTVVNTQKDDINSILAVSMAAMKDVGVLEIKLKEAEMEVATLKEHNDKLLFDMKISSEKPTLIDNSSLEADYKNAQNQIASLLSENNKLSSTLKLLQDKQSVVEEKFVTFSDREAEMAGLLAVSAAAMKDVATLEAQLKVAEEQIFILKAANAGEVESLRSVNDSSISSEPSESDLENIIALSAAAMKDNGVLRAEVQHLQSKLIEARADNDRLCAELNSLTKCVEPETKNIEPQLEAKLKGAEEKVDTLTREIERLEGLVNDLKINQSPPSTSEEKEKVALLEQMLRDINERVVGDLQAENSRLSTEINEKNDLDAKFRSAEIEIMHLKATNKQLESDLKALHDVPAESRVDDDMEGLLAVSATAMRDVTALVDKLKKAEDEIAALNATLRDNDGARDLIAAMESDKAGLEKELADVRMQLQSSIDDLVASRQTVNDLTESLAEATNNVCALQGLLDSANSEKEDIIRSKDEQQLTLDDVKATLDTANEELERIREQWNDKAYESETHIQGLEKELSSLQSQLETVMTAHATCGDQISRLEKEIRDDDAMIASSNDAHAKVLQQLNSLSDENIKLTARVNSAEGQSQELVTVKARLAVVEAELESKNTEVEDLEYQLKSLEEEVAELSSENKEKVSKMEYLHRTIEGLKAEGKTCEKRLQSTDKKVLTLESERAKLEERIKELEESEGVLKKKIEYALAQKQALDPWGFSKEADMGLRRFRTDNSSRKAHSAISMSPPSSPEVTFRVVAPSRQRKNDLSLMSSSPRENYEDDSDMAELSNHIGEMLAGSVPSKHFGAAKSIAVPSVEKNVLPDINQKITFGNYSVLLTPRASDDVMAEKRMANTAAEQASVDNSMYTAEWEDIEPEVPSFVEYHDEEENFKMLFKMPPPKPYESTLPSNKTTPRLQRAKSSDNPQVFLQSDEPLSKTAPAPLVRQASERAVEKANKTAKKAPSKKKELARVKVKNRSVYGCVDTEKDYVFVSTLRQKSAGDEAATAGGLFAGLSTGDIGAGKSLTSRNVSITSGRSEHAQWDSRFQKSPLDPKGAPVHQWEDDVDARSSTYNECRQLTGDVDEPVVAGTVDLRVFGLY